LIKGINVNAKGQKRIFYQPIHSAWSEYAAALYLASVSHYANIIQREVYSLPLDAEPCLTTSAGIYRSSLQVKLSRRFFLCIIYYHFCSPITENINFVLPFLIGVVFPVQRPVEKGLSAVQHPVAIRISLCDFIEFSANSRSEQC
jgi:hypothetical protein